MESENYIKSAQEIEYEIYWNCYERIIERFSDCFYIVSNHKLILFNTPGMKMLNYDNPLSLKNKRIDELLSNHLHRQLEKLIKRVHTEKGYVKVTERKIKLDNGVEHVFDITASYIYFNGYPSVELIVRDRTEMKQNKELINHITYYDYQTGLPNRAMFNKKLVSLINNETRKKNKIAVLIIDLDDFQEVNYSLGYEIGDLLLKKISERLLTNLDEKLFLSRSWGDEFNIIFSDFENYEELNYHIENIFCNFIEPFYIEGNEIYINISMGICVYPENAVKIEKLMRNSYLALRMAKVSGKNLCKFYQNMMNDTQMKHFKIKNYLRRALANDEFSLHYQPQLNIKSGTVDCMEVLIRWNNVNLGNIPPSEFIPIAENTGLIIRIGEWILYSACMQCRSWQIEGMPPIRVAINISPIQLLEENFIRIVKRVLQETKLDPNLLEFEITEGSVINEIDTINYIIKELRMIGILISMDDFGTGYSSLNYLKRLNIDHLKIDKSFIKDLMVDRDNRVIMNSIIRMAHSLKLKVIAEGVETVDQLEYLKRIQCDYIQGFVFCKPQNPFETEKFIRNRKE